MRKKHDDLMRLEWVPLSEITEWPANPKEHDLLSLRGSMDRFGFTQPLLFDETTQRLVAGHGRLEDLKLQKEDGKQPPNRIVERNGEWYVPVIRGIGFKDEKEAAAYVVADNEITIRGGWNTSGLVALLEDVGEDNLEGTGVTAAGLGRLRELVKDESDNKGPGTGRGIGTAIIDYRIVFETKQEQETFYAFLRWLKQEFKDPETIAAKLAAFIEREKLKA